MHIHWRWGLGANTAPGRPAVRYTSGRAIVASNAQSVDVAVTTNGAETVDPVAAGWRGLADGESVRSSNQVLWYVGKSAASSDTFFAHGGFFFDIR